MKSSPSSENKEQDQEVIKLLKDLGSFESPYPPELLSARRAAFLAQLEGLVTVDESQELAPGEQEIVKLLANLKSAQAEYPPDLLAARRSALLQQLGRAKIPSVWDELRVSIQRLFQPKTTIPTFSSAGLMRFSLVIGSFITAVLLGSLFFSRMEQSLQPSTSVAAVAPTHLLPTSTGESAMIICKPDDQMPSCPPGELDSSQDLANPGNGPARPAVSKDARSNDKAAYVNDGRGGPSWVSNSADSWIKIDLGQVTTINTVSLQKGNPGPSSDNHPGQFVIAVALSDVYADGNSSNDFTEYAQVFRSEQTGFSGRVSSAETIRTQFPPVEARYVKITFEKAGAAIEEVGVFMVRPPLLAEQPTRTPQDATFGTTLTPSLTLSPMATSISTGTGVATGTTHTETPSQAALNTPIPLPTDTRFPTDTPTLRPTSTRPPADTATPIPTEPLPSDTPIPLPTAVPPTAIPPTIQPPPASTDPIIVTASDQTLTFTCNGNAAEVRGHANTVILLGSCSSITVTGNGNHVFWQSGSPVITNNGRENIITQR